MVNSIFTDNAQTLSAVNNASSMYNTLIVAKAMQNVDAAHIGSSQVLLIDFAAKKFTLFYNPKGTLPATGMIPVDNLTTYFFNKQEVTLS